jgi:hypothetical protein
MALDLPSPSEFSDHKDSMPDGIALQRASDLFALATGVTDTPSDPFEQRLIKTAVLDMAWYLQTRQEDAEAEFSPFSSERIGSYSYNKITQAAQAGDATGLDSFDRAVDYFLGQRTAALYGQITTEYVFVPPFRPDSLQPLQPYLGEPTP